MARFNIVNSVSEGYRDLWRERKIFLHLALLPVAIKIVGFVAIMFLGLEQNYLRQGLILLPAYFLEGWLIAVGIRLIAMPAALRDAQFANERIFSSRHVVATILIYVLSKLVATFISALVIAQQQALGPSLPEEAQTNPFLLPILSVALAISVWAFRFFWLYVPVALGYGVNEFLKKVQRFSFSFYLIGFWLACFLPVALGLIVFSKIAGGIFPGQGDHVSYAYLICMAIAQAIAEILAVLVSAFGFAHAVREIMQGDVSQKRFSR